jgi:hypothetical protein
MQPEFGYVIGPYRGDTIVETHRNIQRAEQGGIQLIHQGIFPFIPHKNTAYFDGLAPDSFWLNGYLSLLESGLFKVAYCCSGWKNSRGSQDEVNLCKRIGIKLQYEEKR